MTLEDSKEIIERNDSNENKTNQHPTILSLSKPVKLVKCELEECNCGFNIHCPFCDKKHFKPTIVSKVRDHLEFRHFSYAVQFEDVTVVKCFLVCKGKRSGHYHCPVCSSMILKRKAFFKHLRNHAKAMGKGVGAVVALDNKFPEKLSVAGHTVILCDKDCKESKHYHCPLCDHKVDDRNLLITHIWRCEENGSQRKMTPRFNINQAEEFNVNSDILHPKEAKSVVKYWHQSIVRNMKDLPLQKCTKENCCGGKFHCPLCITERFRPSFHSCIHTHFLVHWKKRIPYKNTGYNILICTQNCRPKTNKRIKYHYHCPKCGETKRRRAGFIHHLKICQGERSLTHRYSMRRKELESPDVDYSTDNEANEHVDNSDVDDDESLEDIITHIEEDVSNTSTDVSEKKENCVSSDSRHSCTEKSIPDDILLDNNPMSTVVSDTDEVFQSVTALLSWRFLQKISTDLDTLDKVLEDISKETETSISSSPGTVYPVYTVSGQPENLIKFKNLLKKDDPSESKENFDTEIHVPPEDTDKSYCDAEIHVPPEDTDKNYCDAEMHVPPEDTDKINCDAEIPPEDIDLICYESFEMGPEECDDKPIPNNRLSLLSTEKTLSEATPKRGPGRPKKTQTEGIKVATKEQTIAGNQKSNEHSHHYSTRKTRVDFSALVKGKRKIIDVSQKQNVERHGDNSKIAKLEKSGDSVPGEGKTYESLKQNVERHGDKNKKAQLEKSDDCFPGQGKTFESQKQIVERQGDKRKAADLEKSDDCVPGEGQNI